MKITRINLYVVNVPERHWWWSDDTYGQPLHQRAEHGVAEIETNQWTDPNRAVHAVGCGPSGISGLAGYGCVGNQSTR